jgi:predicted RNase H-like HicB family nuclease
MKDYHINVFWSDDDDCYVADIPDLKFCSAFGETPERAVAEVMIARKLWLQAARETGQPVPSPVTILPSTRRSPERDPARQSPGRPPDVRKI